jgi:hypothetical protein
MLSLDKSFLLIPETISELDSFYMSLDSVQFFCFGIKRLHLSLFSTKIQWRVRLS